MCVSREESGGNQRSFAAINTVETWPEIAHKFIKLPCVYSPSGSGRVETQIAIATREFSLAQAQVAVTLSADQ
jgi:hypothetical protein